MLHRCLQPMKSRIDRQRSIEEFCPTVAGLKDMTEILGQPIGDIERCMRDTKEALRELPRRCGLLERLTGTCQYSRIGGQTSLQHAQGNIGRTQHTGDPDVVVYLRRAATQCPAVKDFPHDGDADDDTRGATRRVASDKRAPSLIGERIKASGKRG